MSAVPESRAKLAARLVRVGRWSLRARLLAALLSLLAVACAVVAVVTAVVLHQDLYSQLDRQLDAVTMRAAGPPGAPMPPSGDLGFVLGPGQPLNTLGAVVDGGQVVEGRTSSGALSPDTTALTPAQLAVLDPLATGREGVAHSVDVPGLGPYRVESVHDNRNGDRILVGLPASDQQDTMDRLITAELCVGVGALVAVGLVGFVATDSALRPLRRVAGIATRVAELRLHQGEVDLHERVPEADTDRRTEVGQVGAALNGLLDHVGSALAARQESELRVRHFVADASHELRTPLASIRGYAELTRRGREETGPQTRHALSRIESEAARMTALVEDLLLLARLDAGHPASTAPLDLAPLDLSPLVVDCVSDARAAGDTHRWRLELPDEPALVHGDQARLRQVLVNLLGNARHHTPPGTTVTARAYRQGERLLLEVADDGPGIAAELLPHIFDRFARGDASRSRHAGSTGLGLAIVHAVVSAHEGEIAVRSAPGGTVFTVSLPPHRAAAAARATARAGGS
ncbi:two-component system OmpR family sensor kinase [Kitasatospora sp. MAA4]|nr:two-component system OmpR family sensor kinase [Kitasatospora sp. MAA4]